MINGERKPLITSRHNPHVKEAARLRDRRQREKQGRILIDGVRELGRPHRPACGWWKCSSASRSSPAMTRGNCRRSWPPAAARSCRLAKMSFKNWRSASGPKACWAWRRRPAPRSPPWHCRKRRWWRSWRAWRSRGTWRRAPQGRCRGVFAVIVADGRTDLYNPNAIRASLGTIFTMPLAEATGSEAAVVG